MKTIAKVVLVSLLVVGCSNSKSEQHHYIVISNNYEDTCEIVADDWSTEPIRLWFDKGGWRDTGRTVTIFKAKEGNSQVYGVNKIIAKEK